MPPTKSTAKNSFSRMRQGMTETALEHDFLTVKEVAALLRVTERKVYDLAASGRVPCSKATGKLLFPEGELRAWIAAAQTGPDQSPRGLQRPPVILGSHDPLLDWAIRHSGSGLATIFDASLDGLRRFQSGEGIAAGVHLQEPDGTWNRAAVRSALQGGNVALIHWATRARGFVVRAEHAHLVHDIKALAKLRIAPRQSEAGSELLLRKVLLEHGVDLTTVRFIEQSRSEQDAMLSVLQGQADVAFGLQALAEPFGLAFGEVTQERYDIVIDRKAWFDPPLRQLFEFTRSAAFVRHVANMPGVDTSGLGDVVWNA